MFIGHYAVGFAAKRFAPRTSLALLMAATTLLDLLWPIFILTGLEEVRIEPGHTRFTPLDFVSYPISHGLVAAVAWATLFAVFYQIFARYSRGAVAIWIGVISHWFLDVATHRPDLPLYAGGPRFGLGLWNHPRATIIVEGSMYVVGVWLYLRWCFSTAPMFLVRRRPVSKHSPLGQLVLAGCWSYGPGGLIATDLHPILLPEPS